MRIAVALLITTTLAGSGSIEKTAVSQKTVLAWLEDLRSNKPAVRAKAAYALRFLDGDADRVLAALLHAIHDRDPAVASAAIGSIALIGPAATESALREIVESSTDNNSTIRMAALAALSDIGVRGVPALVSALKHRDPQTRERAAGSLRNLGPKAGAALPALVIATRDVNPETGIAAVEALGTAGSVAPSIAVPALLDVLENPRQYSDAVRSLAQIGEPAQAAIPVLKRAHEERGWETPEGEAVVRCLARLGAPPALSLSRALIREADIEAAYLLAEFGPNASLAIPVLTLALEDKRPAVRTLSAFVLARINPGDNRALQVLIRAVESNHPDDHTLTAIEALGHLGAFAEPAIDSLVAALVSKNAGFGEQVALCLGQIGLPKPKVLSALATALERDEESVQVSAADAIGSFGQRARTAVPALVQLLRAPRPRKSGIDFPDPRLNAVHALSRMGRAAAPAVETLIDLLRDPEPEIAVSAIEALAALGPRDARNALPHLLRIADSVPSLRLRAASALVAYGGEGSALARRIADETNDFYTRAVLLSKLGLPSSEARAFTRMGIRSMELGIVLEKPESVLSSIEYVCQFGTNASAAIPTLKRLLHHSDRAIRCAAESAIGRVSDQAEEVK